jgi:lipid-A-disaccharide synthase
MDPFKNAIARLKAAQPDLRVIIAAAEPVADQVRSHLADWTVPVAVVEGEADRWALMQAATAALACSGTVTTEIAIAGCPMVVAYRLGPLTHAVALCLLRTKFITLLNVAAGDFVVPERVQYACTGKVLAQDLARLLSNPDRRRDQIAAQKAALEVMRGGVNLPLEAAAQAIMHLVSNNP